MNYHKSVPSVHHYIISHLIWALCLSSIAVAQIAQEKLEFNSKRWSISMELGSILSGPGSDIEQGMIKSGFGAPTRDFLFFSGIDYPIRERSGMGWSAELKYRFHQMFSANVKYWESGLGSVSGHHREAGFLTLKNYARGVSSSLSLDIKDILRAGIGPAYYMLETSLERQSVRETNTKLGFVADIALRYPTDTAFFVDAFFQLHRVGSTSIGPFTKTLNNRVTGTFSRTDANFNFSTIGLGMGLRF